MKKAWWDSGWWSVVGAIVGAVALALTALGLLFPSKFASIGAQMARDPAAFSLGAAWVGILVVTLLDGVLALALWAAVRQARDARSSPSAAPLPPTKRKSPQIFGEIVEGSTYHKQTRQMVLVVAVQNPGEVPLNIQGFKSHGVVFAGAQADVGWAVDAPPVACNPLQGVRITVRGIFASKVTDTLTGTLPIRCSAVLLRASFDGEPLSDIPLLSGNGSSNVTGPITITSD